ncbi:Dolichyl pyrophosphate Glc1Man9GlcNAc2 alpha-1,3-glucosyltransferase [Porphyridium purpureum]|uniref:Alpha-1,3-glucosyltransferase n=1 Tax=Porphyridium purpureum TaxID=35688 RepID=A0A5J4Z6D5_PORPP|nr:Dolichyl pyrophosphate Glc1Man9GlcNAc2 alpha-1,3-glucosyltransferase [Porphyridium purpureum]|eukprot:POR7121..scf295_1
MDGARELLPLAAREREGEYHESRTLVELAKGTTKPVYIMARVTLLDPTLASLLTLSVALRVLLLHARYASTDLNVHRDWMALTWNVHVRDWYTAEISQWTLDYPPLFAYLEYALAGVAHVLQVPGFELEDAGTQVNASATVFLRSTVLVLEILFLFSGMYVLVGSLYHDRGADAATAPSVTQSSAATMALSLGWLSPGILMVDYMHFQYNSIALGLLLWTCVLLGNERKRLALDVGVALFVTALNTKHTLLYVAPCIGAAVLGVSFNAGEDLKSAWSLLQRCLTLLRLGVVGTVCMLAIWSPFIYHGQIAHVLMRMFPFQRGLLHSYWAPNLWALYAGTDKLLAFVMGSEREKAWSTRGLVGVMHPFAVLPSVGPRACSALSLAAMIPAILLMLRLGNLRKSCFHGKTRLGIVLFSTAYCALCSFVFGYHVHEKAILLCVIPLAPLSTLAPEYMRIFRILACAGYYGLLPLLFTPAEQVPKCAFFVLHSVYLHRVSQKMQVNESAGEWLYMRGFVVLELYCQFVHTWWFGHDRMHFLPLMLVSMYAACGVLVAWAMGLGRLFALHCELTAQNGPKSAKSE